MSAPAVSEPASASLERAFREDGARIRAALIRSCGGDFDLAEDALQDAIAAALEHWPREGVPRNPPGWLLTTARRKAIDRLRRERTLQRKRDLLERLARLEQEQVSDLGSAMPALEEVRAMQDDRLRLIFTCCHPALAPETQVALTLRTIAGLETREIARAFLVPEATWRSDSCARSARSVRPLFPTPCRQTTRSPSASRPCWL